MCRCACNRTGCKRGDGENVSTVSEHAPLPPCPMAPPFSMRTMPLGFVPVEPISRRDRPCAVCGGRESVAAQGRAGTTEVSRYTARSREVTRQ